MCCLVEDPQVSPYDVPHHIPAPEWSRNPQSLAHMQQFYKDTGLVLHGVRPDYKKWVKYVDKQGNHNIHTPYQRIVGNERVKDNNVIFNVEVDAMSICSCPLSGSRETDFQS